MRIALCTLCLFATIARAGEVVVKVSSDIHVAHASAKSAKESVTGSIAADGIRFKLQPNTKYDITLERTDGQVEQGVDSGWYDSEEADSKTAAMDDDDRQQIQAILTEIKSFYDRTEALKTWGDHDRAVLLVQRIRESKFHSDKGGEAIWRVELWYMKNEAGGWAKIAQQDKLLRRERFDSDAKMKQTIDKIIWRPELGGVRVEKDQTKTIVLEK
jgi:hypothetical protein